MSDWISEFESKLESRGFAESPSGISYKVIAWGNPHNPAREDTPAIERTDAAGERKIIVGGYSGQFQTPEAARLWAKFDARVHTKPEVEPATGNRLQDWPLCERCGEPINLMIPGAPQLPPEHEARFCNECKDLVGDLNQMSLFDNQQEGDEK